MLLRDIAWLLSEAGVAGDAASPSQAPARRRPRGARGRTAASYAVARGV